MENELREYLAEVQHEIWAHWMRYMFTQGTYIETGTSGGGKLWQMPAEKVARWQRQMETGYFDLTEKERESDRHQADKVLAVLSKHANKQNETAIIQEDTCRR